MKRLDCSCKIGGIYGSGAEFYTQKTVKARISHCCRECKGEIRPGTLYERIAGKWEGRIYTHKTCDLCVEIRTHLFCSWIFGDIWENIDEYARYDELALGGLEGMSPAALEKLTAFLEPIWKEME